MALRASTSGTVGFGLVSIPMKMTAATGASRSSLMRVNRKTGHRLKQQWVDSVDGTLVDSDQMIHAYEFAYDQAVQFEPAELAKLEEPKKDSLEIVEFVPADSVDPIYFGKTEYMMPGRGGERAYALMVSALLQTKTIAVGWQWRRGRKHLVLIREYRRRLLLSRAHYCNQVRNVEEITVPLDHEFRDVEMDLAVRLVQKHSVEAFEATKYRDVVEDRLRLAIEAKIAGQETVPLDPARSPCQVIDLFEALKRSLAPNETLESQDTKVSSTAAAATKPPKKPRLVKRTDEAEGAE